MANPEPKLKNMPLLTAEENARRDAEAKRAVDVREGIPADELRAWLHALIDGKESPMPRSKKF